MIAIAYETLNDLNSNSRNVLFFSKVGEYGVTWRTFQIQTQKQKQFTLKKCIIFQKTSYTPGRMLTKRKIYYQFVIFSPWKVPWNWKAFSQNSFVISPGFLYQLIRRGSGRLGNEAFTSKSIVSSKQQLSDLKITNCHRLCG